MDKVVTIICAIIGSGMLSTIVSAIINNRTVRKKLEEDEHTNIVKGVSVILEDRINYLALNYIEKGWIYLDDKDRLQRMWHIYHNCLHGNGYLDNVMQRVDGLYVKLRGVDDGLEKHS